MKTKKFAKKLALNKRTIASLNNGEMNKVLGGTTDPHRTCGCPLDTANCTPNTCDPGTVCASCPGQPYCYTTIPDPDTD
jgi:natural product precursor